MDPVIVPVSPITPVVNMELAVSDMQPLVSSEMQPSCKRRRKKSIVWDHFTVETVSDGCIKAFCNQCKKSFAYITGTKLAGTSHLKRHIALGICPASRQKNEQTPGLVRSATDQPRKRYRAMPGNAKIPFDQDRSRHDLARMIIMHDYPLHIVEHQGFSDFVKAIQPQFNMVSFDTIQQDCVAIFLREKQNLLNFICGIPGRVSLTLDLWTTDQTLSYILLTGHFIDTEWNFHRRIVSVFMVPYPDSDGAFNQVVSACLADWHLKNRLLTLTMDETFLDESKNGNLRGHFSVKNPLMLNGQLLIQNCYARVISDLAQEALGAMHETVMKIRDSVKFVKSTDAREDKFLGVKQQLQVPSTKDLFIDDQTKWNTTYNMLVAACELKEVFACLETADPEYKIAPGMDEWNQVEILCSFLNLFFKAASLLTSSTYPTANVFFHEVLRLQLELTYAAKIEDPFISHLIKPLKEKFDEYWNTCWLVVAIAVVLDPRYKIKLVEFNFSKIYGEDAGICVKAVDDGIRELFFEYVPHIPDSFAEEGNDGTFPKIEESFAEECNNGTFPKIEMPEGGTFRERDSPQQLPTHEGSYQEGSSFRGSHEEDGLFQGTAQETSIQATLEDGSFEEPSQEIPSNDPLISIGDRLSEFEVYISEIDGSQHMKSELDQYLEEPLSQRLPDFDILGWWKLNKMKYPNLSRMASDVLSIPLSVAAPVSVFDTDKRKMDSHRCSLHPVTVEALICSKDWFQQGASDFGDAFVKMEF